MSEVRAESEFSRPIDLAELGDDEMVVEIAADADERAALARRYDLRALDALRARIWLRRGEGGTVHLRADFAATLTQTCVVSLEPVPAEIEDHVEIVFAPRGAAPREELAVIVAAEGAEPPEPLPPGALDVGEVIAEHLGLALDSYPRRRGAVFDAAGWASRGPRDEGEDSPFAVLRKLKAEG